MRTIVHISDLHFGHADPTKIKALLCSIHSLHSDIVVVSGDVTERGKSDEFRQAKLFLGEIYSPGIVVVPGNHDLPRYRALPLRMLVPFSKFNEHISSNLNPIYQDDSIAVVGVNSARRLPTKFGRFDPKDLDLMRNYFSFHAPKSARKILIVHHPFDVSHLEDQRDILAGATEAMQVISDCQVDAVLSGHTHRTHVSESRNRYGRLSFCSILSQAGTATSLRTRGEPNAFNCMKFDGISLSIRTHAWDSVAGAFRLAYERRFEKSTTGWKTSGLTQF